jgi:hypothetical protein
LALAHGPGSFGGGLAGGANRRVRRIALYLRFILTGNGMEKTMEKTESTGRIQALETVVLWAIFLLMLRFILKSEIPLYLALTWLLVSLLFKRFISRVSSLWFRFSRAISQVNNWVILSMIFFVFLTPLALLYRLLAKNPLMFKKEKNLNSYFNIRNYSFTKKDFEKLW